jgi:endonuclease/exonuclease/phosphatase family metal-dependent hydrolase
MKKIIIGGSIAAGSVAGLFLLFLIISSIAEFNPPPREDLFNLAAGTGFREEAEPPPSSFSVFTWNIGYAGLDAGADFILDGGNRSIALSKEQVHVNMNAILGNLSGIDADYYMLQEVDHPSNRSYYIDEVTLISDSFSSYSCWFATNFHVLFVPYPLFHPIGPVHSGIVSLSRYRADSSTRISLPGQYGWPVKLFHLKRCMNVIRLHGLAGGRNLYLINLHLSAYDRQGELRTQQLDFIKDFLLEIYIWGDYVIAGGDWNALLPGVTRTDFAPYTTDKKDLFWVQEIPDDWTPEGWQWAFDPGVPTCRSLEAPYEKGKNFTIIIDGFLVSPNIEILDVKGFDLGFRHSDHNPLLLKARLKTNQTQD